MKTLLIAPLLILFILGGFQWRQEVHAERAVAHLLSEGKGADALAGVEALRRAEPRFISLARLVVFREQAALAAARDAIDGKRFLDAVRYLTVMREQPESGVEASARELERQLVRSHLAEIEREIAAGRNAEAQAQIELGLRLYAAAEDRARLRQLQRAWRVGAVQAALDLGDIDRALAARSQGEPLPEEWQARIDAAIIAGLGAHAARLRSANDLAGMHRFFVALLPKVSRDAPEMANACAIMIDEHYRRIFGRALRTAEPIVRPVPVYDSPVSRTASMEIRNNGTERVTIQIAGAEHVRVELSPGASATVNLARAEYLQLVEPRSQTPLLGAIDLTGPGYVQVLGAEPTGPTRTRKKQRGKPVA